MKVMLNKNCLCSIKLAGPFDKARKKINEALHETGFEVIYEINFSELIENRLGIKIKEYLILEILNPYMAVQFLLTEPQSDLFIHFRIIIREHDAESVSVFVLAPKAVTNLDDNTILKLIAREASEKLTNSLARLQKSM